MAELKITLKRSVTGCPRNWRATVKVLGLGKVDNTVTRPANEAIKDMVNTISCLVDVEEA